MQIGVSDLKTNKTKPVYLSIRCTLKIKCIERMGGKNLHQASNEQMPVMLLQ